MMDFAQARSLLEDWYLDLPPAWVTVCRPASGEQIREPSLTAAQVKNAGHPSALTMEKFLAAGQEAHAYEGRPGTVVFSPFRQGQIACYDGAQYLFRTLLRKVSPGLPLAKPVVLVHLQENTTQVEKIALTDAAIQAGARRVLLCREPFPALVEAIRTQRELHRAVALDISP